MKLDIVYNEDCMGEKGIKILPNESIDMILCDLPYEITSNKWDTSISLEPLWKQYKRIISKQGVIVLTASQPFTSILVTSNRTMFKHEWIWIKNRGSNFANTVREPMKEHESILIFANKTWTYNKQMQQRTGGGLSRVQYDLNYRTQSENYGNFEGREDAKLPNARVPSSWQKFNCEVGLHPTQKPVTLFKYLIKTYTNEGDVVLDNCMGSGTTAIACKRLGRHYIGFEINPDYCEMAKQRLSEVQLELI